MRGCRGRFVHWHSGVNEYREKNCPNTHEGSHTTEVAGRRLHMGGRGGRMKQGQLLCVHPGPDISAAERGETT